VPEEAYELAEVASTVGRQRSFILKNTRTDRFLILSDPERFLWERMDGATSLQDVATAYVLEYGEFDFDIIPNLMRKLQRAQLLTLNPSSRLRQALARNRRHRVFRVMETTLHGLERVKVSSRNVQPFFERLYRWGGFLLFSRLTLLACFFLAVAGASAGIHLWRDVDDLVAGFGARPVLALVSVKVLFFFTLAAHQIVHGLALIHYRRRVREFGFTLLHGFIPTFYVDVTDIFMASRRGRVVTAVSGALVHLVLGCIWFLIAAQSPLSFIQAFAGASGLIQLQAFVLAIYPFCFIEMDGYHVLVDVLGLPTLKHDALAYANAALKGTRPVRWTREETLWIGYVALSTLSIALFIGLNIWMIVLAMA
jgi:putative peptide zinc metalloprotease protein